MTECHSASRVDAVPREPGDGPLVPHDVAEGERPRDYLNSCVHSAACVMCLQRFRDDAPAPLPPLARADVIERRDDELAAVLGCADGVCPCYMEA